MVHDEHSLTRDELYLLDWLAKQDGARPDDCLLDYWHREKGKAPEMNAAAVEALDNLIAKGLVIVITQTTSGHPLLLVTHDGFRVASGG